MAGGFSFATDILPVLPLFADGSYAAGRLRQTSAAGPIDIG